MTDENTVNRRAQGVKQKMKNDAAYVLLSLNKYIISK